MGDRKYLTAEEVSERYRGAVSVGRCGIGGGRRVGPAFVKIGKAVLYPVMSSTPGTRGIRCRAVPLDD
jgi:hypothetical protein